MKFDGHSGDRLSQVREAFDDRIVCERRRDVTGKNIPRITILFLLKENREYFCSFCTWRTSPRSRRVIGWTVIKWNFPFYGDGLGRLEILYRGLKFYERFYLIICRRSMEDINTRRSEDVKGLQFLLEEFSVNARKLREFRGDCRVYAIVVVPVGQLKPYCISTITLLNSNLGNPRSIYDCRNK